MNDDIVERLRAWSPLISSGFPVPAPARVMHRVQHELRIVMDEAAGEIERLRARVEVLTQAVEGLAISHARAALEGKQ